MVIQIWMHRQINDNDDGEKEPAHNWESNWKLLSSHKTRASICSQDLKKTCNRHKKYSNNNKSFMLYFIQINDLLNIDIVHSILSDTGNISTI